MKRNKANLLFLLLWATLYSGYSFSSSYYGHFEPLTVANGLNNNTVYNLLHGDEGFIWLSTDVGISRFDGFRFRNYPYIPWVDGSMKAVTKSISKMYQDQNGLLYLQLTQGGIACFDRKKEQYLPVHFTQEFDRSKVTGLYVADKGILYVATTAGLYSAEVKQYKNSKGDSIEIAMGKTPLFTGSTSHLCGDDMGNLFFCYDKNKVMHYSMGTQQAKEIATEQREEVSTLCVYGNNLWICRKWADLVCYDFKRNNIRVLADKGGINRPSIEDTYITNIAFSNEETYYLSTWAGLFCLKFNQQTLNTANYTFDCMTRSEKACATVVESKMLDVLWDSSQNVLWMGTFGGGAIKMAFNEDAYSHISNQLNMQVTGIEEDAKGHIWLSTERKGIWRSRTNDTSDTTFDVWAKGVKAGESYQMHKDKNGSLWLGDTHAGLLFINPITEEIINYTLLPEGKTEFSATILQLCLDSREHLWVGTTEGLILFNPNTRKAEIVLADVPGLKEVYSIAEDKEGNIWIGTNIGLKRLETIAGKTTAVGEYEQKAGLAVAPVFKVYVNNSNQIFSSYTDKIIRIDGRKKEEVESAFTLSEGLINGHTHCLIDDGNGNTWIGSNSGIMTIRNDRHSFYHYFMSGYCNNVCRLRDGRLLWSNSWGLIAFDPFIAKKQQSKKQLLISDLWVNGVSVETGKELNEQIVLTTAPEKQKEFIFNANNNDFNFYFSDMQYGTMQRKVAYRLLPKEEWKLCSLEEGIHYSHLAGGSYTLQAKLVYPDASEGDVLEIPIVVRNAWWQTWWAYMIYILLVCGLATGGYYMLSKKKKRYLLQVQKLLQKEQALIKQAEGMPAEESAEKAEVIPNLLITRFMEELHMPLSLIIAPLKEISKEKNLQPELLSQMYVAYRNSIGLLNSVDHLLGIYTHNTIDNALKVSSVFIEQFVDSFILSMSEFLQVHPIKFEYNKKVSKDLEVWIDKKQIEFILHNLLSNAFIHINYSGDISLTLEETKECYVITVTDSGKGEVKPVKQLMDTTTLLHSNTTEVELGYDVMENILRLHHGSISMTSGKTGTTVAVTLPIGDEILQNDPNVEFAEPEQEDEKVLQPVEDKLKEITENVFQIEALPPITSSNEKKTILVIEDYNDIRLYLKVLFEREYNVLLAENGDIGVKLAKKELPDLIICDVMMPIKDGFQCCKEIKEGLDTCHIPFIMLTAKVEDDDVMQGLEAGADDYILKPFTAKILKAKVRNLIQGRLRVKQMYAKFLTEPEEDNNNETVKEPEVLKVEDPFIDSVIKIIEENIGEADFNVKKLASDMNMSQPTLYRKVKQSTDFTIIELIRGVRMRKAAVLLKQKQYAVQEVAEMIGYNDIPTFRKHFVDAFGTTPSTYAPEKEE